MTTKKCLKGSRIRKRGQNYDKLRVYEASMHAIEIVFLHLVDFHKPLYQGWVSKYLMCLFSVNCALSMTVIIIQVSLPVYKYTPSFFKSASKSLQIYLIILTARFL